MQAAGAEPKPAPAPVARHAGAAAGIARAAPASVSEPVTGDEPRERSELRTRAEPRAAEVLVPPPEDLEVMVDLEVAALPPPPPPPSTTGKARPIVPDLPEEDTGAVQVRQSISSAPAVAKLGRFELLGRVAAGGMAEIYLGREQMAAGQSRSVALKLIRPVFLENQSFEALFVSEGRVGLQLAHPHICHVYEFGKIADRYFIAMEWIDGVTLLDLYKRSREANVAIPVAVYVRITADIAGALHFAHRLRDRRGQRIGVVHRDVSPQNIMISYDGVVKLLDFGVAKERNDGEATGSGTMKGKLGFLSPEQARGQAVDGRSDLFGLGVCLFEAITGKSLHRRANQYDTMRAIMEQPMPPIAGTAPDIDESLERILQRALAKSPADRFRTAGEMQEALEQYLVDTRNVVTATRVSRLVEKLFAAEIVRGPVIEATTLAADLGGQSVQVLGEGSGSDGAEMPLHRKDSTGNIQLEPERISAPSSTLGAESSPVGSLARPRRWLTPAILLGAIVLVVGAAIAFWSGSTPQTASHPTSAERPAPREAPDTTTSAPREAHATGETGTQAPVLGAPTEQPVVGARGATSTPTAAPSATAAPASPQGATDTTGPTAGVPASTTPATATRAGRTGQPATERHRSGRVTTTRHGLVSDPGF